MTGWQGFKQNKKNLLMKVWHLIIVPNLIYHYSVHIFTIYSLQNSHAQLIDLIPTEEYDQAKALASKYHNVLRLRVSKVIILDTLPKERPSLPEVRLQSILEHIFPEPEGC